MGTAEQSLIRSNLEENRRGLIRSFFGRMKQYNVSAQEIKGRRIRVSAEHWVTDFASCNYLGLDLDPEMDYTVSDEIKKWGVHPSWCRLVASPAIYDELEEQIARLVGTEACVIFPTVTLISIGVIPALVGKGGVLILDKSAHETMYEAAKIARDNGATLVSYNQNDLTSLEELLHRFRDNPRKIVLIDGVYSMTGDYAILPRLAELIRKYDAFLYIDDAHGFGVVGGHPDSNLPYGYKGNGIVQYFGADYRNVLYVGGCSKAYSSLAAFICCSKEMETFIEAFATPYDLSGPCPTASLATLKQGLIINELRGDVYRQRLWRLTDRAICGLRALGYTINNETGFPIVSVRIGDTERLIQTANMLFDRGVLVTVAPFPMVRPGEEVHRLTLTAANTEAEVDAMVRAFEEVLPYALPEPSGSRLHNSEARS